MPSRKVYRESLAALLPNSEELGTALAEVLAPGHSGDHPVEVIRRETFLYASTFPSEIVTCREADGAKRTILCKYGAEKSYDANGHGGGPRYEALVYRNVIKPSAVSCPAFFGEYRPQSTGETWLFIEYVAGGRRVDDTPSPESSLVRAAAWIGHFHATQQALLATRGNAGLRSYTQQHYHNWARRLARLAGGSENEWLRTICRRFRESIDLMTAEPQTVIHGEFTVHNVLRVGPRICPVDWESAAIAAGEIDLASITEAWPPDVVRRCEAAYQKARWPQGPPPEFSRRLQLSRLYWNLRWMGHKKEWFQGEENRWRLNLLRTLAEGLEWI